MPTDASGNGIDQDDSAASHTGLSKAQLDAVLSLASAGDPKGKNESTRPGKRDGSNAVHIAVWDTVREVKVSGAAAPTEDELTEYLASHPHCIVYQGQKASGCAKEERPGLERLSEASLPPSKLGAKHLFALKEQAPPQLHEEPTKRSMFSPEQLQRLQVIARPRPIPKRSFDNGPAITWSDSPFLRPFRRCAPYRSSQHGSALLFLSFSISPPCAIAGGVRGVRAAQ